MAAIDVLMPMRDAAPWVGAAWASLARQSFRDWRVVAVDDGSCDDTVDTLGACAGGDGRLCVVRAPARGVAAALNRGLREVSAPVTVRMDADDLAHPRRLEALWSFLREHADLTVASSRVRLFPRRLVTPTMGAYLEWQNRLLDHREIRNERYVECTVTHAATAFHTRLLLDEGGWWEGEGPEDLDLFLRLHAAGARFGKVPLVLYLWREREGRVTRTSPRLTIEAFRRTKARHLAAELASRALRRVSLFGTGESLRAWSRALDEQGVEHRALDYRPRGPADRRRSGTVLRRSVSATRRPVTGSGGRCRSWKKAGTTCSWRDLPSPPTFDPYSRSFACKPCGKLHSGYRRTIGTRSTRCKGAFSCRGSVVRRSGPATPLGFETRLALSPFRLLA
jgi:hypothetical protein